jgi:Protein of unknown function (DUF2806)
MTDPITAIATSRGLTKLTEAVTRALGKWYEPIHVKRMADAKAHEKLVAARAAAQSKIETQAILNLEPSSEAVAEGVPLLARAAARVRYQEERRQENVEKILQLAERSMSDQVSAEPVDETWMNRFFDVAAEVSHAQMQDVWGKILAGEVSKPGSFSLRSLETLRNLLPSEAIIFQDLCSLLMGGAPAYKTSAGGQPFGASPINFDNILKLRSAGLVISADILGTRIRIPAYFQYYGVYLIARPKEDSQAPAAARPPVDMTFESVMLTDVGLELSRLVETQPNWQYVQALAEYWLSSGVWLHVAQGFVTRSDGSATWTRLDSIPKSADHPTWTSLTA